MKKLRYKKDTQLWEYLADSIVSGVPISYFDADTDAMAYRDKVKNKAYWKNGVGRLQGKFDKKKVTPVYYCLRCRRLEDGAHRILVLPQFGMKKVRVRIGEICYKRAVSAKLLPGDDTTIKGIFARKLAKTNTEHVLDGRWMAACADDKWPRFKDIVNFRDKTVLDIGCNSGYSAIMAWAQGASHVIGLDIREDVINVGRAIGKLLKINKPMTHHPIPGNVEFLLGDFARKSTHVRHSDVVMCFGLLHYFPERLYDPVVRKLCAVCRDTLLLELRIIDNVAIRLETIGKQTLPTSGWLEDKLNNYGFKIILRSKRPRERELWVLERKAHE